MTSDSSRAKTWSITAASLPPHETDSVSGRMTSLIAALSDLHADERATVLQALVRSLSLDDVRRLRALTAARLDFLAQLPAEILPLIFQHLPLEAAWTSQLVCTRWRAALSDPAFLMARLNRDGWHDERQTSQPTADMVRGVCRHRQAFRNGQPFTHWKVAYASDATGAAAIERQAMRLALHDQQLAWISRDDGRSRVVLRDLSTGVEKQFFGEARENIMYLALTSCLLAYVSFDGILYIVDLTTPEGKPQIFRLPSINITTIAGDGKVVGLLLSSGKAYTLAFIDFAEHIKTLRSVTLDIVETFRGPEGPSLQPYAMIVDGAQLFFDVFLMTAASAIEADSKTCLRLGHMRFKLRECRDRATALSAATSPISELYLETGNLRDMVLHVVRCSEPDLVELDLEMDGCRNTHATFSRQSACLTLHARNNQSTPTPRDHSIVRWHDAIFHVSETEKEGCIYSYGLEFCSDDNRWHYEDHGTTTWITGYETPDRRRGKLSQMVLRNEHFIVVCSLQGEWGVPSGSTRTIIRVLGMDERLPLADGQSTGLWTSAMGKIKAPPEKHAFRYRRTNYYQRPERQAARYP